MAELVTRSFEVRDYDLGATLTSGQAFRWVEDRGQWTSVLGSRWVGLQQSPNHIIAQAVSPVANWDWLTHYLQLSTDLDQVIRSFPADPPLQAAVQASRGLRLLRQDPWECLASFILSSTKQIVQIQQVVDSLCRCFGSRVEVPEGSAPAFTFPSAKRVASLTEPALRACKMGFRAPYLLETGRIVASGQIDLVGVANMPLEQAREALASLPGVGRKIADCVLLFAYGFDQAFPVDVWVMKALQQLYFQGRPVSRTELQQFAGTHFGPHAGYAQQYLFHYMRTQSGRAKSKNRQ